MRGGPVADRRLDPAALHPTATFVDGWLQARPRDWLAQVGTVALDPRRGYASALVAPLGHVTVVGDHVHAIRLANAVTDQARRQVKQVTLGHRGRTYDPPYLIRKLLVTAAEQLTERGRARLRARDTMRIERGGRQVGESRQHQVASVVGAASRYRTTCRCGSAAHRPRPSFGTPGFLCGRPPT
jgi:hypothetical protein